MEEATKATKQREQLEKEKAVMIDRYMGLQDRADELNEKIYRVCCDIEILNQRIEQAREEELKEQAKLAAKSALKPSSNGSH